MMTMQKRINEHYHQCKQNYNFKNICQNKAKSISNTGVINGFFPKIELGFVPGTNIPAVFLNSKTSDTYVL
jgi:hypothetical protein